MLDRRKREPQGRPGRRTTDDAMSSEATMRVWLAPRLCVVKRTEALEATPPHWRDWRASAALGNPRLKSLPTPQWEWPAVS
jgi:hypothetical protein